MKISLENEPFPVDWAGEPPQETRRNQCPSISNKLTAETQRTQSRFIIFIKELLCVLCVSAVNMEFMAEY